MIDITEESRTLQELTETELQTVQDIIDAKVPLSPRAEIILMIAANDTFYHHVKKDSAEGSSKRNINLKSTLDQFEQTVRIYPNPATDNIFIENLSLDDNQTAKFDVYNLLGIKVITHTWDQNIRIMKISTNHLLSGVYIYRLYINEKSIAKGKLSVLK